MIGFRRPARRWWGWLVAITYLLGSLTPSIAAPLPAGLAEVVAQRAHETLPAHEHAQKHQHSHDYQHSHDGHKHIHGDAKVAVHSHDGTSPAAGHADQDRPDQHGNCCGSVLCLSAISPQAPPSLLRFAPLQSRCESEPDSVLAGEALGPLYRPPIA